MVVSNRTSKRQKLNSPLKSGFRALKEHHFRYILAFIYDFTNTNHRVKRPIKKSSFSLSAFSSSFYSPLCSGRSAFNHFHAILPLEWRARMIPRIFHTGHALHSHVKNLKHLKHVTNTPLTSNGKRLDIEHVLKLILAQRAPPLVACRRSCLNRFSRVRISKRSKRSKSIKAFSLVSILLYCIINSPFITRIKPLTALDIPHNDNNLTHNAQIKHRDYTNV